MPGLTPQDVFGWLPGALPELSRSAIALVLGAVLLMFLINRLRSDSDPSISETVSVGLGTVGVLLSGVWATAAVAAALVWVTWPLATESMLFGGALVLAVVVHGVIEQSEASGLDLVE